MDAAVDNDAGRSSSRAGARMMAGVETVGNRSNRREASTSVAATPIAGKAGRQVKWAVDLPAAEHAALQALRRELGAACGGKVKRSRLLRVACRMLLQQERSAVAAALAAPDLS